jgi:alkylated DNA repair dioxygenase AlkB
MTHSQLSLFPDQLPDGLLYRSDYLTVADEAALVASIGDAPWRADLKRRVQHYGYRYDYKARQAHRADYLGPMPEWLDPVLAKLCEDGLFVQRPDQVIVNEYLPGQGISAHVDCEPCFGDRIASISLLGGCMMAFTELGTTKTAEVYLEPCSILLMHGPARSKWTHAIPARKSDTLSGGAVLRTRRISLTCRTMRFS